jgi:hypothetical protein
MNPPTRINKDTKTLTYKEYLLNRYTNIIMMAREMEKTLGKQKTQEIIRDAFYKNMTEMVREELKETGPIHNFQDFVRLEKQENETPHFKNIVELTYPYESPTELTLNVTRCLHAEIFKELDATDLGYLIVCNPDHAYAQASHPNIKLRRTKTIMQGDPICNHTWYWEET